MLVTTRRPAPRPLGLRLVHGGPLSPGAESAKRESTAARIAIPADASTVVLVVSGTHGVEGFLGSALQQRILKERVWNRASRDVC